MDWLWIFFEVCNVFFEVLMMKTLAEGFLKNKRKLPKYAGVLLFVGAMAVNFWVSTVMNGNFVFVASKTILLAMLISFVFCRGKIYWHGIVAFTYYIFIATSELIGVHIISALQKVDFTQMIEIGIFRYQVIVIVDIIFFLFIKLICHIRKGKAQNIPLRLWFALYLMPIFSLLIMLQMTLTSNAESNPVTLLSVLSVLSVLFINVLIFYVLESVVRQAVNKERVAAMEAQLALQKDHNQKLAENRSQIQQLSHDFKQHVQTFQMLSEQGQYEELSERIKELAQQQKQIRTMLDTGNPTLDALLTAKRETAEQNGIQWLWNIQIPPDIPISIIEICAILGNALDNAIEACLRTESHRFISLDIHTSDDVLLLEVKNTLGQQPKVQAGRIQTLKENAKFHGLGLKSMEECCRKLGGQMSWDINDVVFEVHILIPF